MTQALLNVLTTHRSGSLGTLTASRNQHGPYYRDRTVPADPTTTARTLIRSLMHTANDKWERVLSQTQRTAWNTYASNQPLTDRFGHPTHHTGRIMYLRSTLARMYFGYNAVNTAPTTYRLPAIHVPTGQANPLGHTITINFDTNDEWVSQTGAALLLRTSKGKKRSIHFWAGPYLRLGFIAGSTSSPPTSPKTLPSPYTVKTNTRWFLVARCFLADGRLSTPRRFSILSNP